VRTRLAVRVHLFLCRMCRAYLEQLRRTVGLLRGRALAGPPAEVEGRIVAQVKQVQGTAPDAPG
jgi:anti-sigma factor RsiW